MNFKHVLDFILLQDVAKHLTWLWSWDIIFISFQSRTCVHRHWFAIKWHRKMIILSYLWFTWVNIIEINHILWIGSLYCTNIHKRHNHTFIHFNIANCLYYTNNLYKYQSYQMCLILKRQGSILFTDILKSWNFVILYLDSSREIIRISTNKSSIGAVNCEMVSGNLTTWNNKNNDGHVLIL